MSFLAVEHLHKRFAATEPCVVDDVSFEVLEGEIFVLLGSSGCGKTTTLRMIAGFERPDSGAIRFLGRTLAEGAVCLPPEKRGVGFVFQEYALFPHLSVFDNVMFGLRHLSGEARRKRATHLLEMVGMAAYRDRKPHQLSGGQQQRVALARSFAPAPKLMLLDEPFSNLDAALRSATREEVRKMLRQEGMSAVLVTHDQEEALTLGDRIAVMHKGKIEQMGRPEAVYRRPANPFVARFLGRTNLVKVAVPTTGNVAETPLGKVRLNLPVEGEALLSMRPEHLRLEPPRPGMPRGKVLTRVYKGHDLTYHIVVEGRPYEVHTDYRCPFQEGDEVALVPAENAVVVWRGQGDGPAG